VKGTLSRCYARRRSRWQRRVTGLAQVWSEASWVPVGNKLPVFGNSFPLSFHRAFLCEGRYWPKSAHSQRQIRPLSIYGKRKEVRHEASASHDLPRKTPEWITTGRRAPDRRGERPFSCGDTSGAAESATVRIRREIASCPLIGPSHPYAQGLFTIRDRFDR
jgi:hypothetical protein